MRDSMTKINEDEKSSLDAFANERILHLDWCPRSLSFGVEDYY
jgi:hypothetical protein